MRTACLKGSLLSLAVVLSACGGEAASRASNAASAKPSAASVAAQSPASGGSSASAAASGDTLQSLIEGAKKEGALSFSYGGGTLGGNQGIKRLGDAFNKAYGTNLNVQLSPGDSMPNMVVKITQEYQAKKPASTDVVLSLSDTMNVVMDAHSVIAENWKSWGPNIQKIQSPDVTTPDGSGVTIQTYLSGISYNTNKLTKEQAPTSMADLLKPELKGKISSTVYATAFDWLASDSMWGYDKTLDYVKKLSAQLAGVMRCGEDQRVVTGEFYAFALACSQSGTLKQKALGAPIDYAVPSDALLEQLSYAAVPMTAPHPNAAKLWVDFLLSPEAQQIMREEEFTDSHLLPNSVSSKLLAEATKGNPNAKVTLGSVQYAKEHYLPNGPKYKDEFAKILLGK